MIADKLEDTPGFAGLYGEVVTEDVYRLRKIPFIPEVVLDVGANIGIFSRFARSLWPDAQIIAIEPNPDNISNFRRFTNDALTYLVCGAIGSGQMYRAQNPTNGSGECYFSAGPAYPAEELAKAPDLRPSEVQPITLARLIFTAVPPAKRSILKIDIEGNEQSIYADKDSMAEMARFDYIVQEIHPYAIHGGFMDQMKENFIEAQYELGKTHWIELDLFNNLLIAYKKTTYDRIPG